MTNIIANLYFDIKPQIRICEYDMLVPTAERETFVEQVWKRVTQQSRPDSMHVAEGRNLEIKPHHFLAAPWRACHLTKKDGSTPPARAELGVVRIRTYLSTIVEISDRRGNTR